LPAYQNNSFEVNKRLEAILFSTIIQYILLVCIISSSKKRQLLPAALSMNLEPAAGAVSYRIKRNLNSK